MSVCMFVYSSEPVSSGRITIPIAVPWGERGEGRGGVAAGSGTV